MFFYCTLFSKTLQRPHQRGVGHMFHLKWETWLSRYFKKNHQAYQSILQGDIHWVYLQGGVGTYKTFETRIVSEHVKTTLNSVDPNTSSKWWICFYSNLWTSERTSNQTHNHIQRQAQGKHVLTFGAQWHEFTNGKIWTTYDETMACSGAAEGLSRRSCFEEPGHFEPMGPCPPNQCHLHLETRRWNDMKWYSI